MLSRAAAAAKKGLEQRRELDAAEASAKQGVRVVEARADAVVRLLPMLDAGLAQLARDLDEKKGRLVVLEGALREVDPAARTVAEVEAIGGSFVRRAVEDYERQVAQRAADADSARRSLDAIERTQASLTNLVQQLRSVAQQIIEHTHDDKHCPLCATPFERADLQQRLRESMQSAAGDEGQRMRQHVQETELAHQRTVVVLHALQILSDYRLAPSSRTTVRALLTRIAADREEFLKLQSEVDALRHRVQEHERRGWTLDRLAAVAGEAGIEPSDVSRESVERLNADLTKQRAQYIEALSRVGEDRSKVDEECEEIAREVGLPTGEPATLLAEVSKRATTAEQAARAVDALAQVVAVDLASSDLQLEARLREAHEAAVRVHTASLREQTVNEAIRRESKIVEEATAEVAALRVQVGRVDSALNVISELIRKQSGQQLTNQVLRENGAQIAATFGRIHAPSEFDVEMDEDGLRIIRRSTKTSVDLHEMSSGQRAAFTLSLFLAMNGRLRTGPNVIVFDDPIAHVDDINTLSFMDHLREIALEGERQIFFATADSKLAGLFARKFRFMGDQFKQIELGRES